MKDVLSVGPSDCLCDAGVWAAVEAQALVSGGMDAESLRAFTRACNIPNHGAGTC